MVFFQVIFIFILAMDNKVDFVITWVDGNNPVWLRERNHYI